MDIPIPQDSKPTYSTKAIYLAARYSRREEILSFADVLREYGFHITSRWLHGYHQAENDQLHIGADAERFALEDLYDINDSNEFMHFTDPPRATTSRGGQFVELGYAIALNIPITIIGPRANVFHCIQRIGQFNTFASYIDRLEKQGHKISDTKGKMKV